MSRPRTTRLRESETRAPNGAKVIDAQFDVIGRRTIWDRIGLALAAVFWAAVIGFAIPQLWILSQGDGAFFAGR
jgi:hypothetical protein